MKNSEDYATANPPKIEAADYPLATLSSGYVDSSSYLNHQNELNYSEGFQLNGYSFAEYNQENVVNKLSVLTDHAPSYRHHPYDRPPTPKQCEKCGFICESLNLLTEHINSCHPPTPLGNVTNFHNYNTLSGGEIIKNEFQGDLLDLDSYKVSQGNQLRENQNQSQNQGQNYGWHTQIDNSQLSPGYHQYHENHHNESNQSFVQEQPEQIDEYSTSKSSERKRSKNYNCTACNKWFTSSGHLKRHYNTTLHKKALNMGGFPDPANLPIKIKDEDENESSLSTVRLYRNEQTNQDLNETLSNESNQHSLLMPFESVYVPEPFQHNNPSQGTSVVIINDQSPFEIANQINSTLESPVDNAQRLPSFNQIQRFGQMPYYNGDYLIPNQTMTYQHHQQQQPPPEEENEQKYPLIPPPDSTSSTDGDYLPEESMISSPEASSSPPEVENSSPQISSTSNIVKPQPVHRCYDCHKVFNKACYLTQHNKTQHSGSKPFKCIRCGKRFSAENLYLEHRAKHSGEKPHKCNECPKQFNHKTDLRRHMCLHTGKKPFVCDVCGKGFIRKDHLMKHGETHWKKPMKNGMLSNMRHAMAGNSL